MCAVCLCLCMYMNIIITIRRIKRRAWYFEQHGILHVVASDEFLLYKVRKPKLINNIVRNTNLNTSNDVRNQVGNFFVSQSVEEITFVHDKKKISKQASIQSSSDIRTILKQRFWFYFSQVNFYVSFLTLMTLIYVKTLTVSWRVMLKSSQPAIMVCKELNTCKKLWPQCSEIWNSILSFLRFAKITTTKNLKINSSQNTKF